MADLTPQQGESLAQSIRARYQDMGDGTHALVIAIGPIPAGGAQIGNVGIVGALPAGNNNIGDVDVASLPAGNLGQRAMAASLSVVPASDITDPTYIGDIRFGEELPAGTQNIGDVDVLTLPPLVAGAATIGRVVLIDAAGTLTQMDSTTGSLDVLSHAEHEIHEGRAFEVFVVDTDFDKADEISISFTTPDTASWLHMLALAVSSTFATFDVLRGPTVTAGTGIPFTPRNRNENSAITSGVISLAAIPLVNRVSVNATIAADGFVFHREVLGGGKNQSGAGGSWDSEKNVLRQNTTYAFRLKGTGTGSDNQIGGIHLSWHEHINL